MDEPHAVAAPRPIVLLVEDDADVMLALTHRIKASGFDVVPAPDGVSAIAVGHQRTFAAAVVDINLPGRDGFEVAEALSHTEAKVIMITASRGLEIRERAESLGCAAFIEKPFTGAYLVSKLRETLSIPSA